MSGYKNIYKQSVAKTPVAFCNNKSHRGGLTTQLLRKHKCLSKNCPFLKKNMEERADFWNRREAIKRKKKLRKKKLMAGINNFGKEQ